MEVKKINDKEYFHWLKMFYIGVCGSKPVPKCSKPEVFYFIYL